MTYNTDANYERFQRSPEHAALSVMRERAWQVETGAALIRSAIREPLTVPPVQSSEITSVDTQTTPLAPVYDIRRDVQVVPPQIDEARKVVAQLYDTREAA